jgi:hypothetical protein
LPRPPASAPVAAAPLAVVLVADGARADTMRAALDAGALPALARLRDEGGLHEVSSVFPSVTGMAYTPFVMGRFPGPVGLPGLRWFDRARTRATWPDAARSYVGAEMRHVDRDLDPAAPTLYELVAAAGGRGAAALEMIGRGLPRDARLTRNAAFALRAARTHFRGDLAGWLAIDELAGARMAARVRAMMRDPAPGPRVLFGALTGIDKTSHSAGHEAPCGRRARIADACWRRLRADAERGRVVARTHGVRGERPRPLARARARRPADWFRSRGAPHGRAPRSPGGPGRGEVAVMVSGNAMAHVYWSWRGASGPCGRALAARWSRRSRTCSRGERGPWCCCPGETRAWWRHGARVSRGAAHAAPGRGRGDASVLRVTRSPEPRAGGDPLASAARTVRSTPTPRMRCAPRRPPRRRGADRAPRRRARAPAT